MIRISRLSRSSTRTITGADLPPGELVGKRIVVLNTLDDPSVGADEGATGIVKAYDEASGSYSVALAAGSEPVTIAPQYLVQDNLAEAVNHIRRR